MTAKQRTYYFKLWARIVNRTPALIAMKSKDRDAARQAFNFATTGLASSRDWKHSHFDGFIALAKYAIENGYEAALARSRFSKGGDETGERKRLVWGIRADAAVADFGDEYIKKIGNIHVPLFGELWPEVDMKTLHKLRITIRNRAKAKMGYTTAQMDDAVDRWASGQQIMREHGLNAAPPRPVVTTPARPAVVTVEEFDDELIPF